VQSDYTPSGMLLQLQPILLYIFRQLLDDIVSLQYIAIGHVYNPGFIEILIHFLNWCP